MKPKMVKAFVWVVKYKSGDAIVDIASSESQADHARATRYPYEVVGTVELGPIVRIEVPAPVKARKERKS